MERSFGLYEMADRWSCELAETPRLASWDAAGSPSQAALGRYLDHVEALVDGAIGPETSAMELVVGQPPVTVYEGYDLDNYLFPLVWRLGPDRFDLVRGSKVVADRSTICVGRAEPATELVEGDGWRHATAKTTASAQSKAWKEEVNGQMAAQVASPAPDGPLRMEIGFRVGPRRNWVNLWKQAIDSLGPIVGEGGRPFAPQDDRIVDLGLHRQVDRRLMYEVELAVWWRSATEG